MEYASFFIGDSLFGVPIVLVQEISRVPEIFPIPGHDQRVEGLINLRGRTTVVVNIKKCLYKDATTSTVTRRPKLLILETKDLLMDGQKSAQIQDVNESVIFMVDDMYKIIGEEKQDFHPPPAHVHEEYIEGVMNVNGDLITLLSVPRLIQSLIVNPGVESYE